MAVKRLNSVLFWGTTTDNSFITIGAQYSKVESMPVGGYDHINGCQERVWEAEDGRTFSRYSPAGKTERGDVDKCSYFPLYNRMLVDDGLYGYLYNTPGTTNTGVPGWSETNVRAGWAGLLPEWVGFDQNGNGEFDTAFVDADGDGYMDVNLQDPMYSYRQTDRYKNSDYGSERSQLSVMVNGEYNFQDNTNSALYYDVLFSRRKTVENSSGASLFQWVSETNPFNPCGVNGVGCTGSLGAFGIPTTPTRVRTSLYIPGDRDNSDVDIRQISTTVGFKGDLPVFENIGLNNWYYDTYLSHSTSTGDYTVSGISESRLVHSLDTTILNDDGSYSCGDGSDGCVPVNLFRQELYVPGQGRLTQAEEDYLFVDRYIETSVDQTVFNAYVGGALFALPWNNEEVNTVWGVEYRRDAITSVPNDVTREGHLWGYFKDKGATGSRSLKEVFAEVEFPLIKGQPYAEEVTITAAGRLSDESTYGTNNVYSVKGVYRPTDWFTLRGTYGTSYRTPNLRERFVKGISGFSNISDPCVVPTDARGSLDENDPNSPTIYDSAGD